MVWLVGLALLFVAFSLPLVIVFSRRDWRTWQWWLAAATGGVGLFITLSAQPPLQIAYSRLTARLMSGPLLTRLMISFGVVLISGLVQELLKILAPAVLTRVTPSSRSGAIALGAASGTGFGVVEAIKLVALPLAALHVAPALALWERAAVVTFHCATGAYLGAGVARGRGVRAYLAAALLHGLLNFSVILQSYMLLDPVGLELWVSAGAIIAVAMALRAREAAIPARSGGGG
ncbi:MAG: hypothetical protein ACM3XN_04285 [Chloroflexota bacterium]